MECLIRVRCPSQRFIGALGGSLEEDVEQRLDAGSTWDATTVIIDHPQKTSELGIRLWFGKIFDGLNFGSRGAVNFLGNGIAQICGLGMRENTFLEIDRQLGLSQRLSHKSEVTRVLVKSSGHHEKIIKVTTGKRHGTEQRIHEAMKSLRGVPQAKGHAQVFERVMAVLAMSSVATGI